MPGSGRDELGRGIIYQYAYVATLTLAGAAFYIYAIHFFPSNIVGSISLLIAILQLFPLIFSLGLGYGLQHFISYEMGNSNKQAISSLLRTAFKLSILISAISDTALVLTAPLLSQVFFHSRAYTAIIYLLALDVPGSVFIGFLNSVMLGLQKFRASGAIGVAYVLVVYISAIAGINILHSVYAVPAGWAVGYTLGAILYLLYLFRAVPSSGVSWYRMKGVFAYSLPLYVTGILSYGAGYIDRLTVAYLKDLSSIGIYNLALLITGGVGILSSPIGSIIFSKFSEFYARNDRDMIREGVRLSISASAVLFVPAALGLAAISREVILLIAGPVYLSDALPLSIILAVNAFLVMGSPMSNALQGTRRTIIFIISTSSALASNLILSIALIPRLYLVGAAIGYSSTTVASVLVVYYFARLYGVMKIDWASLSRVWISAGVMAVAVYFTSYLLQYRLLFMPAYVALGIAIYLAMLKITAAVSMDDRKIFASLFQRHTVIAKAIMKLL